MKESAEKYEKLNPFNRAFITAVLELKGVVGTPTLDQFQPAMKVLDDYYAALAAAKRGDAQDDDSWLEGLDITDAGRMAAFCYVQFGVVEPPTAQQRTAFNRWRGIGTPSRYLN